MASSEREARRAAAQISRRIPRGDAAAAMVATLRERLGAFEHVGEESHAEIVAGLERSLARWARVLAGGSVPPDADFDPLREWTRERAAEGLRLEDLLRAFALFRRLGWELLTEHAREDEQAGLLLLSELSAEYLEQVTLVVTETYLAERELLVSEEERRTRSLLDRLCVRQPLGVAERDLAERLGVPLDVDFRPFEAVLPGSPPHRHAALAARLRRGGWRLAVTQSDRVTGLLWSRLRLADLDEPDGLLLAIGEPTPRAELAAARAELATLVDFARTRGVRGMVRAEEWLLEGILARSPRLAARLAQRVLAPLAEDAGALEGTLRALLEHRMDRTATSASLQIHRNTLAYRLARIEKLTGLNLSDPRDLACVHLALQARAAQTG